MRNFIYSIAMIAALIWGWFTPSMFPDASALAQAFIALAGGIMIGVLTAFIPARNSQ